MPYHKPLSLSDALAVFHAELARAVVSPQQAAAGPALWPRFAGYYQGLARLPRKARRALQRQWRRSLGGLALLLALGQAPALAATILHEYGEEYFENYQESPYMERTLRFKQEMRAKVPAVVHVDGTGRLQTVKREWNARFHALIEAFHRLTNIPLLLNTSFNIMGKPMVHTVEDALGVFFTTGMDALVIEDYLLEK